MTLARDADYANYLYTCNRCRACTTMRERPDLLVCPSFAHRGFFAYSGGGKGYLAQGVLEGRVRPTVETAEVALHCTLCHACASMCPPGFETIQFIRDLRAWLVSRGVYANPAHFRLLDNLRKTGNPVGRPRRSVGEPGLSTQTQGAEALLFLGCYFGQRKSSLESIQKIISAVGARVAVLADEPCCGSPALELGEAELFARMAEQNIRRLNAAGVSQIITLCPHCTSTLVSDYLEFGEFRPEVIHLSEWLAGLMKQGKLGWTETGSELAVTVHDPCHLTRYLERGEVLRQVLEPVPGIKLQEMPRSGESSYCCGGGSFMFEIAPALWRFAATERIQEAQATGAQEVVTACPYCQDSLSRAGGGKIQVIALADLLAGRLE